MKKQNLVFEETQFQYQAFPVSTPFDLIAITRSGITKKQAVKLAHKIDFSPKEISAVMHISERTFHRYQDSDKLDSLTSGIILQLTNLYDKGALVFGDIEKFKQWMKYPNPVFSNNKPIDLLDTMIGFQLISDELGRIEHGIFA